MDDQVEALLQLVPTLQERRATVTPLSGGITNRNFRIDVDGASYVLRIGSENTKLLGIDRACEYACASAAAAAGIGPEVVAFLPEHHALVTRFVSGRVLTPEDTQQLAIMRRIVEALQRYHAGPPGMGAFSPFTTVRDYHALARRYQVPFPHEINQALGCLARIEAALSANEPFCPCHNDLLPANFIDDGLAVRIIDWEYAGMGDRFFDLGNLAVNHRYGEEHERLLLELYFGEVDPEHLRRLRLMRLASDMREALWGFLQAGISTLDFDFLGYGRTHLERFLSASASLDPRLLRVTA